MSVINLRSLANSNNKHWNSIYSKTGDSQLGWYEKTPLPTLKLLKQIPDRKKKTVFIPGAGTSLLIEELLAQDMKLIINDISSEALNRIKDRLQNNRNKISWLCQDISQPVKGALSQVDIWIDRAVLHFLTSEDNIAGYFENIRATLKTGGHVILAEFSKTGAPKCAGLTLHRYSLEELSERLGPSFRLISHFDSIYTNPNGDPRPYIYTLFKKEQ